MELGKFLSEFTKDDLMSANTTLFGHVKWPWRPKHYGREVSYEYRRLLIDTYVDREGNKDDFIQYFEYRIAWDLLELGRKRRWLSSTLNELNETDIKIEDPTHKAFAIFLSAFPTESLRKIANKLGVAISTDLPDRQSRWLEQTSLSERTWNLEQGVGSGFQYPNVDNPYHWFVVSRLAAFVGDDTRYKELFRPTFEHNKEKVFYCSDCKELKSMENNNCISCGKALHPIECEWCGFVNRPLAKKCIGYYEGYEWDGTVCHRFRGGIPND